MDRDRLATIITPILTQFDLELEAIDIVNDGVRMVLRIIVDGDGPSGTGPHLEDITEATRAISRELDDQRADGTKAYTLEVSSRGTSRPLAEAKHWRRNRGRLVKVSRAGYPKVTGRIVDNTDQEVTLDVDGRVAKIALREIATAIVQVELKKNQEG